MNEDRVADALLAITRELSTASANLESLTQEVRRGFDRGAQKMDAHEARLDGLEKREAGRTKLAGASLAVVSFLGLERVMRVFGLTF